MPFSDENLMLSFKPKQFFYELSRISGYSENTLRDTMSRAVRDGLIIRENLTLTLTEKGMKKARPFIATKLPRESKLLVVFDIPEYRTSMRHEFRNLLKQLDFRYVQQSVWVSRYDHRETLAEAIKEFELQGSVIVYEAAELIT